MPDIEKPFCLLLVTVLYFSPTSAESLKALERVTGEKDIWVCLGKEKYLSCLTCSYVEIIFLVYDLMDTKEIFNGDITLD